MAPTVIHSVVLFDGNKTHLNATVVFNSDSGTITSVSSGSSSSQYPQGATVINGAGHSLIPGLIDTHIHCTNVHLPPGADDSMILRSPLKCGVTTVCDMHSDLSMVQRWRKAIAEELAQAKRAGGTVALSDLKSSLYGATIEGGWPKPIVLSGHPTEEVIEMVKKWPNLTPETASDYVKNHKANGADYIKLMQENCCSLALPTNSIPVATLELQTAVVKAAHENGLPCVGHALSADMTEIVLKAGADGLTHTFVDQPLPENITALYKETNAFVIPTFVVLASLTNELQDVRERFADLAFKKGVIDEVTKQNMIEVLGMKAPTAKMEYAYDTVAKLKKEGIDVVAGTDAVAGLKGTGIGPSLWMELELYTQKCGFSSTEALTSATAAAAKRFGFADRGEVTEGKRADLVLVKGNVAEKLQNLWEGEGIVGVWKEGLKAA
ncbi:hypothetical protein AYO21_05101 [Fonsecaea monophora]|uniref:Amidohydrolase-related domain-containing protein n=1 Tax=Fonsecaea monophora TaxID=254056 RepID=A0A177F8S5_9EURO|nr:hypothetical protein AYO21_05101 [Fonsecaea monophora]OAG40605.1 hypothetical protein AYO21_05101 [Fonsecaea monophora]